MNQLIFPLGHLINVVKINFLMQFAQVISDTFSVELHYMDY